MAYELTEADEALLARLVAGGHLPDAGAVRRRFALATDRDPELDFRAFLALQATLDPWALSAALKELGLAETVELSLPPKQKVSLMAPRALGPESDWGEAVSERDSGSDWGKATQDPPQRATVAPIAEDVGRTAKIESSALAAASLGAELGGSAPPDAGQQPDERNQTLKIDGRQLAAMSREGSSSGRERPQPSTSDRHPAGSEGARRRFDPDHLNTRRTSMEEPVVVTGALVLGLAGLLVVTWALGLLEPAARRAELSQRAEINREAQALFGEPERADGESAHELARFQAEESLAERLARRGDYAEALAVYEGLPSETRSRHAERCQEREDLLRRAVALSESVEALLAETERLRAAQDPYGAVERVQDFQSSRPDLPAALRVRLEADIEHSLATPRTPVPLQTPEPVAELPSVQPSVQERAASRARVRELRERLQRERAEADRQAGRRQGSARRVGTGRFVERAYSFREAGEVAEWSPLIPGSEAGWSERGMAVRGNAGLFLVQLAQVPIERRIVVQAVLGRASPGAGHVVGVAFAADTPREVAYLAGVDQQGDVTLVRRTADGALQQLERAPGAAGSGRGEPVLSMELRSGTLRVRWRHEEVLSGRVDPLWERTRVFVGGASSRLGEVQFTRLLVRGARRQGGGQPAPTSESLAPRSEPSRAPTPTSDPARPAPIPPLSSAGARPISAEHPQLLGRVPARARRYYEQAKQILQGEDVDLPRVTTLLGKALSSAKGRFPAARLRLAVALAKDGRFTQALDEAQRAQRELRPFPEAVALEAWVLAELGELSPAEAKAQEALRLAPDSAWAYAGLGLVQFLRGEQRQAMETFGLAVGLDPGNPKIRSGLENLRRVQQGPDWSRTFRVQSANYLVETNVSQAACQRYSRALERVRLGFAERFSGHASEVSHPARVLVFATREGFHRYAELTMDDRMEHLVGVYLPRFRQLLLYQDPSDASGEKALQVLRHEAFHQFIHRQLGQELPLWINEGLAEFYAGDRRNGAGGIVLPERLRDLEYFLDSGGPVRFDRLMRQTPQEFYSGPVAEKYAQAWTMIHFFELGARPGLRERYERYLFGLMAGESNDAALSAAFEDADWRAIESQWRRYVSGLR